MSLLILLEYNNINIEFEQNELVDLGLNESAGLIQKLKIQKKL